MLTQKEKERVDRTNAANSRNPIAISNSRSTDSIDEEDSSEDSGLMYDPKADEEDFEPRPSSLKASKRGATSKASSCKNAIKTRGSNGISTPSKKRKELEQLNTTSKKSRTEDQATTSTVGAPHPTNPGLIEAPPGMKCQGCNKVGNQCNEILFGGFALQQSKNYIKEKGVGATFKGIEEVFFKSYNSSFRFYMWAKHWKNVSELTEIEPTACVWNSSFVKTMQYHTENFMEIIKSRVEERVLARDYNWDE